MDRKQFKQQAGAYRAYHRKALAIGFHSAGVVLPSVPMPAGFAQRTTDPLIHAAANRPKLLQALREDRAMLAERALVRADNAALGITHIPEPILSDALVRRYMAAKRAQHLRHVRGVARPLALLVWHEERLQAPVRPAFNLAAFADALLSGNQRGIARTLGVAA